MKLPSRKTTVSVALLFATLTVDALLLRSHPLLAAAPHEITTLPVYTAETLAPFDGINPRLPVYIALDGYVYDVSAGREHFYNPGKPYQTLAGRDSSQELHMMGGAIIKKKYPIVGQYHSP